ncbi:DUF2147 domain-containing protein [Bradyrhizobium viridifuturi]|jgi:uncharacterized protein (DUF2147 family)|uniref:DUF2147 domain-containing protein n=1 Tax=Bradyrhizobium TaxID=374 RepID=UPI0003962A7B|nr:MULTISPECIES: DUF2147 domain-containing protein [Bradyrhizobium]ERF81209.1 MAG: xanthine dehydrogenase accessory factor [Bradyrhizobium sp. DFCI-1]OYU58731.1 MAG: DUF2147 domain-containing protein [Bradyrhizobium sp. PARBB1]PSO26103.1 DUF2147 domain-containing protein [Bradyrhizobium sp. MOS004]QRI71754.1 DUF2147 domain-containing protein [Bradyrhizobium sp. PSBB068]MBR1024539.1 DUF2147 domain-containing protein [Bradyrhizobium viridifuturi]
MLHCPRTFARTIAVSGLFLATVLSPALAADPTGDWKVADGVATIRVAQCNGNMWGVVSWEKTPGGKDKNNPDPAKQSRPTLGMPILIDMKKKAGADAWEGQVYNAKDGQLYSSTIKPVGTDQLEIQGCVLGFLCGGETWTRVGPPIPVSAAGNPAPAGAPAAKGALPKPAAPQKTTGAVAPAAKPAQKQAATPPGTANASADTVGDICLLPDIARPTH